MNDRTSINPSDYANSGVHSANIRQDAERTFVVLGVGRGGTSMVSGMLHKLGVYMGERMNPTYEDFDIKAAVKNNEKEDWLPAIAPIIAERNAKHREWGFKLPRISRELEMLEGALRNPFFIFIFRDPVAVSVRNVLSANSEFAYSMRRTLKTFQIFATYMETTTVPYIAISYEKALLQPAETVEAVMALSGIDATPEQVDDAVRFITPTPHEYLISTIRAKT
jgi:hypothetical protein